MSGLASRAATADLSSPDRTAALTRSMSSAGSPCAAARASSASAAVGAGVSPRPIARAGRSWLNVATPVREGSLLRLRHRDERQRRRQLEVQEARGSVGIGCVIGERRASGHLTKPVNVAASARIRPLAPRGDSRVGGQRTGSGSVGNSDRCRASARGSPW